MGALRSLPLNLHGVLFNEGAVVLDRHTVVFGGVYSNDRVHLRRQARVYFDDGITRQQPTTWSRDCRQAPRLFDDVIGTVEFYRKDGSLPPRRGDLHIRRR